MPLVLKNGAAALVVAAMSCAVTTAFAQQRSSAPIRGVVRAVNQAAISIDFPVRVAKLHFREAQSFKRGEPIVTFDCKRVEAERKAALAQSREAALNLQSQTYLEGRGAVGKLEVEIARARADKAEAEAAAIETRIAQCVLVAPFDGRIADLKVNEHEVPAVGQPFVTLVDEALFEIDLILPSKSLKGLEPGSPFTFLVDETGLSHPAKILRVGAAVDPVSQSIRLIGAFDVSDRRVVAGMSGTASGYAVEGGR